MFNVDVVLAGCPLAHQDHDGLDVVLAGAGRDQGVVLAGWTGAGLFCALFGGSIYFQVVI